MPGLVETSVINLDDWLEENKQFFLPPVCNKMMHQEGQMKLFLVGGPNQRKDFHIEFGDELFMQLKGDMVLKIVEHGKHRDLPIKEGEMFLLPGRIAHSPQRFENTVGLVLERERHEKELDGLRYYMEEEGQKTTESLYEEWVHVDDLGTQLAPIIKRYFASEQCATGKPLPGTISENPPIILDAERTIEAPFNFKQWLEEHSKEIDANGKVKMFNEESYQFRVHVYGKGTNGDTSPVAETWIWQWSGSSQVRIEDKAFSLNARDSLLVPVGKKFSLQQDAGSRALVCFQDQTKSPSWPKDA